MKRFVGVDGCKAGWFAIALESSGSWTLGMYGEIERLWRAVGRSALVLIDVPIGLMDSGPSGRLCDVAARRYLGRGRASSVFTPPVRSALEAKDWKSAARINRLLTGRSISVQTWAIVPKIREVDRFLRSRVKARETVREAHPEILFWALNGGRPMRHPKRRLGGLEERLDVLRRACPCAGLIVEEALGRFRRAEVGRDDIVDALAAAVTGYVSHGELATIPDPAPRDGEGLPMEMVYYSSQRP